MPNSDPHEISSMNRGDRTGDKAREKIYYISIKMGCSVTLYINSRLEKNNSANKILKFEKTEKLSVDIKSGS